MFSFQVSSFHKVDEVKLIWFNLITFVGTTVVTRKQLRVSLNHRKVIKPVPSQLITRKLAANPELSQGVNGKK